MAGTYEVCGWAIMVASFLLVFAIQLSSTANGLLDGQYSVLMSTNIYGENFAELGLEILAIPAVISTCRRFLAQNPS